MFKFGARNLFICALCTVLGCFFFASSSLAKNKETSQPSIESKAEKQEVFVDITWNTNDGSASMHHLVKCIEGTPAEVSYGNSFNGDISDQVKAAVTPMLAPNGKNFSLYIVLSFRNAVIFDGVCHTENGKSVSVGNKDITFSILPSLKSNHK